MNQVEIGSFAAKTTSLKPTQFPDEKFDLFSLPAYDQGATQTVPGSDIGSSKQIVAPGDVMISKIVPHIRRVWIVPQNEGRRQIASGEWIVFRSSDFHGPWLRHLLLSESFHRRYMQTVAGVGGSLLRARPAHVFKIKIQVPDLDEQSRTADILDKADDLRAKRRKAIAHLDVLGQSIFHEMFGDPVASAPARRYARLDEVGTITTGNTPPRSASDNYGEALEWAKTDNINSPGIGITQASERLSPQGMKKARIIESGSILMTCIAGSPRVIGNVALADRRLAFNQQINAFTPAAGEPYYWLYLLMAMKPMVQRLSTGGMKGLVSKSSLSGLEVPMADENLQKEFAYRVSAVENLKSKYHTQLAELDDLFLSLQDRAFKGEL